MKTLILISLTFLSNLTFGQVAIISDKDGYSNIRSKAESGSSISDTLNNGHFVFCLETKGNWTNIDYSKKKNDLNGFIFHEQVNYDKTNDILYIQSMNSDGAGSYYVIWRIEKGVYIDRYIAYGF